jgi:hypothetical protein
MAAHAPFRHFTAAIGRRYDFLNFFNGKVQQGIIRKLAEPEELFLLTDT